MKNTTIFPLLHVLLIMLMMSCGNSNNPDTALQFSRMEIHYIKSGGWINTSKLFIYGDGSVIGFKLGSAKGDTLKKGDLVLSEEDRIDLAKMFEPFPTFKSYYEPDDPLTDQNLHTTIFYYEEVPDTATVYMPEEADIPDDLRRIIDEMEALLDYLLG